MFNLAQEHIFDRYKNPQHAGEIEHADVRIEGANPVCGDEILITARFEEEGKCLEIKHKTRACAICTASADLLAEHLLGKTKKEIAAVDVEEVRELLGIPLSPLRLKCALLPLEALKQPCDSPI